MTELLATICYLAVLAVLVLAAWVPFAAEEAEVDWARFLVGAKVVL